MNIIKISIICVISLLILIILSFFLLVNLKDSELIKEYEENITKGTIVLNDKIGELEQKASDIQKQLNEKTIECSEQQKETNKELIQDYTDYSNLCCVKKEQCRDELRDVKLNLTKYTDRYNCLKYNGTEVC